MNTQDTKRQVRVQDSIDLTTQVRADPEVIIPDQAPFLLATSPIRVTPRAANRAIHEQLPRIHKVDLRQVGWAKATELAKVARRDGQRALKDGVGMVQVGPNGAVIGPPRIARTATLQSLAT